MRVAALAVPILLTALHATAAETRTAKGGITEIRITSQHPAFGGATFGAVGAYEMLSGKAYGTIDPRAPGNAGLVYLDNAPRNADGLIDYSMDFVILRPVNAEAGNGRIFYEVVNRGSPLSFAILNKGSLTSPGNGFLMNLGYEIVFSGWQPEANPATTTYKAYFPIASNGAHPVTKTIMEEYVPDLPETNAGNTQTITGNVLSAKLTYPPNPPVTAPVTSPTGAILSVRQHYDDARQPLSTSAITFTSPTRVSIDLTEAIGKGMDAGAIYELVYQAQSPFVGGVGFVSVRDLVSYLRHETADRAGNPNPARPNGMPIAAAFGWGRSQSGRFIKDFIYQGFNADLTGRIVFDGVIEQVSGSRMTDHNLPFAQTSRWIRQHEERDYPGADFPFTYQTLRDPLTGKTDGILKTCTVSRTCPKIFHVDSDFESWNSRISLVVTDTQGRQLHDAEASTAGVHDDDGVVLPENVRAYQLSGQAHRPGNGIPSANPVPNCKLVTNPLDDSWVDRALVVAMDEWATKGTPPPASEYPNLAANTLQTVAQQAAMWPTIPGFSFNPRIAAARVADRSTVPPTYGATYPIYVPKIDPVTGNPVGGVIGPDLAAPLGTYMGRNFRAAGHAEDELCGGNSGFIPFAATKAARIASGDSRPSLSELYPSGAKQFYAKRRAQIEALISKRLALPGDIDSWTNEVPCPP